jgi:hypothetical protein
MKSFKDIRQTVTEDYYTGPTVYSGSDYTNAGDQTGTDLGNFPTSSRKSIGATVNNIKEIINGFNVELAGTKLGANAVVSAMTKARAKLNGTGLNFDIDAPTITDAVNSGNEYSVPLLFGDRALGSDAESPVEDTVAAGTESSGSGIDPVEKTLPSSNLVFSFTPNGTGYRITATLM